jgi:flagellar hook-associated protein 3 FlgL
MRVTPTSLMNQSLAALSGALARLARTQERLGTGRRILHPGDDPAGHAAATRLASRVAGLEQFRRQAGEAHARLTATSALLDSLAPLLGRVQELAVAGADGSKGAAERAAMAVEVDALLEELVAQTNRADDGRHLLGGRETLTPPLGVTRDAGGQIVAAAWNPRGVDDAVELAIGPGLRLRVNTGGTDVLGADTAADFAPALLVGLREALEADDPEGVRATIDGFASVSRRLSAAVADAGSRLRQAEATLADLDTAELAAREALSRVADADLARVAAELGQQELAYQAALQATARAVQPSLLDFLR